MWNQRDRDANTAQLYKTPPTRDANSRETNKQPQLQKQAQFFDDLLSSILFIINYLLPINEPATYYSETTLLSIYKN